MGEKESLLDRVRGAVRKVISGPTCLEGASGDDPQQDFTKMEKDLMKRASKREIVYRDYRGALEIYTQVVQMRAERIKGNEPKS